MMETTAECPPSRRECTKYASAAAKRNNEAVVDKKAVSSVDTTVDKEGLDISSWGETLKN